MHELRVDIELEIYFELLEEMIPQGYQLWALSEHGAIKALAGIAFRTNLYYGRYVWVFDLVTTSEARSKGHGEALLRHVEDLAREKGCDTMALSSGLQRIDAHRFYEERMGYQKASYAFTKRLAT